MARKPPRNKPLADFFKAHCLTVIGHEPVVTSDYTLFVLTPVKEDDDGHGFDPEDDPASDWLRARGLRARCMIKLVFKRNSVSGLKYLFCFHETDKADAALFRMLFAGEDA